MKRIYTIAACLMFAAVLSVAVKAQAQTTPMKVVLINTLAFDDEKGITKYVNAMNALENEFKPLDTEIQGLVTKYNNLGKEIKTLQDQASGGKVPIDEKAAQAKVDEYQLLEIQIKRKQEDAKTRYEKRQAAVLGPVLQDIGKAMQEFAQAKGYDLILDAAKLDQQQILLAILPAKIDVTKEFITFYNARPASATATTKP